MFLLRPLFSVAALSSLTRHSLPSHSFFPRFCLTERSERSPRELVYFPIERRSTERARDGYLRRAGQTDRPDVIESRYFIVARAFELRVLALLSREWAFCVPRRVCAPDDWKIIYRVTCGYCQEYSFSYWLGLLLRDAGKGEERPLRLIYHSEHSLRRFEIVSLLRVMKRRYTNDMIDNSV